MAWPNESTLAVALAEEAGRPATWPGLGSRVPAPLRLIVVPNVEQLVQLTRGRAPEWGAGVALPDARTIVVRADAGDPREVLRHELAHLALHEVVRGRVPLWFDEGFATWAAGGAGPLDALSLNLAVARGDVPTLRGLDGALRRSATSAQAAYALAASAVLELARRNPQESLAPLLEQLQAGVDFDAAVLATTGLTTAQFEAEWQRAVRRRYSLAAWAVAGGAWGLLALAAVAARRLRRRADRERRAALDEGWEVPDD